METTIGTSEIIETVLGHIAQNDGTRRVLPVYRKKVSDLAEEEQIQLWDIMQRLLDWRRAQIGTKLLNDALAILKQEMEMPEIEEAQ